MSDGSLSARAFRSAVRLSYTKFESVNKGAHPVANHPVLILHGLFGSKQNWQTLAKNLKEKLNQTVITVDGRNHGASDHDADQSYEAQSQDIEDLLRDLDIPKAVIIGHSMAEQVEALIVVDAAPSSSPGRSVFHGYFDAMKKIQFPDGESLPVARRRILRELEEAIPELSVRQFIATNLTEKLGKNGWRIHLDALHSNLENIMEFPVFHNFFGGSSLFIRGGNSNYITEEERPEIKRLFPKAVIKTIDDAGHWVHAEKPHEVILSVVDFLRSAEDH